MDSRKVNHDRLMMQCLKILEKQIDNIRTSIEKTFKANADDILITKAAIS